MNVRQLGRELLCALFGHRWNLYQITMSAKRTVHEPVRHESNVCLRCRVPITDTDEAAP